MPEPRGLGCAARPLAAVQVHWVESPLSAPGKDPVLETAWGAISPNKPYWFNKPDVKIRK